MTLVLFILPVLLYILRNYNNKYVFWLFSIFMFVLLAFRDPYAEDNDTHNYQTLFFYGESYLREHVEFGYFLINLFVIKLGLGFQWVLIITSFVSIGALSIAALRSDKKPFQVLIFIFLLTYYYLNFNAMRQMTGVSILLLGYTYLAEGQWKVFIFFTLIASLFHATSFIALIALVFYFKNFRISPTLVNFILPISLIVGSLNITPHLLGNLSNLLPQYIGNDISSMGEGESFSTSRLALTFFFMYMYPKFDRRSIYTKLSLFGIILFNLMSYIGTAMRIAYAFTTVQAFLYAIGKNEVDRIDPLNQKIIYAYALFVYYYLLFNNISGMLDYQFCDIADFF